MVVAVGRFWLADGDHLRVALLLEVDLDRLGRRSLLLTVVRDGAHVNLLRHLRRSEGISQCMSGRLDLFGEMILPNWEILTSWDPIFHSQERKGLVESIWQQLRIGRLLNS